MTEYFNLDSCTFYKPLNIELKLPPQKPCDLLPKVKVNLTKLTPKDGSSGDIEDIEEIDI
jgi:hypothetical protein